MAVTAAIGLRVHMQGVLTALEFICMTVTTYIAGYSLEEPFLAAHMGAVTGNTSRISLTLQVGMHPLELGQNIGVTLKASGVGAATGVTGGTLARVKGLVLKFAQQIILLTRVGMVTFETVHLRSVAPHVFALPRRTTIMAWQTQLRPVTAQKAGDVATVNRMALCTLTVREGDMLVTICLFKTRMTGGAHLFLRILEQTGFGAGVGCMTRGAFPLAYRRMAVTPLPPAFAFSTMTLAAQLRLFLEEQPRVPRHMQAVARIAIIVLNRGVLISALEVNTVMTLNAVKRHGADGSSSQKQERQDNMHKTFIYHGVLSS